MNNNLSVTMTTVNIGDKVLTIMGDTVDLVMEAGAALEKYFNVVPEESEIEEAEGEAVEAGAVEAVLPEDVVAGEMETDSGQATEMPALNCSEGGGDEDTSGGAQDSDRGPGLSRARPDHCRGHRGGGEQCPGAQQQHRRSECGTQVQSLS